MGERNDLHSWFGYDHSNLESYCNCSYTPQFSSNQSCPYKTDRLGNVIEEDFPSSIEEFNANFSKIVKRVDLEKSNSSIEINQDPSVLNGLSSMVMKCELHTVSEVLSNPISWDSYFMNIAILTSKRSSDINTKVGACLVDESNRIIGCGYNGIPKGLDKSLFPTNRDKELHESKYGFVVHAEANALLNTTVFDLTNSKLYCTLFPCNECVKFL